MKRHTEESIYLTESVDEKTNTQKDTEDISLNETERGKPHTHQLCPLMEYITMHGTNSAEIQGFRN